MRRRVLVEGWRFIPHSYALVAQSHCLCLLRRGDVDLRFVDLPYYNDTWRRTRGVFAPAQEVALAALRAPEIGFAPDVTFTLRPERPDLRAPAHGRKFAFATCEYRVLTEENRSEWRSAAQVADTVSVLTPSRWSALAFERFGMPAGRIRVVPHGVDPEILRPDADARDTARAALGLRDSFVFLSVGGMFWNKGLDLLLTAFSRVAETERDVRLVLKGADALYPSAELVREVLDGLPARARETIAGKLDYYGETYSSRRMADMLRAADVYVSPYRAEGFNMPVLEAAACGVPLICTAGGPTDEFTDVSFARRIRSTPSQRRLTATEFGDFLEPDLDHLVELMHQALRERGDASRVGAAAAEHIAQNYTWERVTERLLEAFA